MFPLLMINYETYQHSSISCDISLSSDIFQDNPSDPAYQKDHVSYSAQKILSVVYVKRMKMEIPSTIYFIKKIAGVSMTYEVFDDDKSVRSQINIKSVLQKIRSQHYSSTRPLEKNIPNHLFRFQRLVGRVSLEDFLLFAFSFTNSRLLIKYF